MVEDPGITAVPEPYYTGRYLDGVEVTLIRPQTSGIRLQEEGYRLQASGFREAGSRCSPRPCESV